MESVKRTAEEADSLLDGVKALIVDIEGTTTPIDFVKESLFPYVTENIEEFLTSKFNDEETKKDIQALRELAAKDAEEKIEGVVAIPASDSSKEDIIKAVVENVKWQMDKDRKSTALKALQGHIWKEGYSQEKLKAELFEDVGPNLQQIVEIGIAVYVYSSGSVESQKLLFANTDDGNLLELFTGFYDTTTGPKTDSSSYTKIAEDIEAQPDEILFLTDNPDEAAAAVKAGLRSAIVVREGNEELSNDVFQNYLVIESFNELFGDDDEEDFKRIAGDNGEVDDEEEEGEDDELDEEDDEAVPEDDEDDDEA